MTSEFILPTTELLVYAHKVSLRDFGGSPGIRDQAALDAALARPRQILAYADDPKSLSDIAAALCFSIGRHRHPFIDGNKRVAFTAVLLVLGLNGCYLDATEKDAEEKIFAVSEGSITEEALSRWISQHSRPLPPMI